MAGSDGRKQVKIEPFPEPLPEDKLYDEVQKFWVGLVARSFATPASMKRMTPLEKYPGVQTNEKGEIAIKYRQPGRVFLGGNPSGKEYVAVTEANICLAWVDPLDVDFILAKRDGCCGGKRQSFYLANESDVRRWTNKGGQ
jgi:hypothetical protein